MTELTADKRQDTAPDRAQAAPARVGVRVPEISKGEKVYNWTVYSGLNYWTNLIGSIWLADKLINGNWRNGLDWIVGKTAKAVQKSGLVKTLESAHHNSKIALETLAFTGGGWLLLIPMKWMEDRKRPIVHWLNDKFGVNQTAPDGHAMTPDEIYIDKEQPHQSWWRVIGRRIIASLAVVGTGSALDKLAAHKTEKVTHSYYIDPFHKETSEIVTHTSLKGGKERATDWIVNDVVGKGIALFPGGKNALAKMKGSKVERWVSLAALDTFFTKITAMVMYVTRGAKKEHKPKEIDAPVCVPEAPKQEPAFTKRFAAGEKPRSHTARLQAEPPTGALQPGM